MDRYGFILRVEGLDLDDLDVVDDLLSYAGDVTISAHGGTVIAQCVHEGSSADDALIHAVAALEAACPGVRVTGLDGDLVAIPDIADRTGRSRESVRLLVDGKRGPGGFPAPSGVVGDGIRVWCWSEVNTWLRECLAEGDDEASVPADVAAVVNGLLAQRSTVGGRAGMPPLVLGTLRSPMHPEPVASAPSEEPKPRPRKAPKAMPAKATGTAKTTRATKATKAAGG